MPAPTDGTKGSALPAASAVTADDLHIIVNDPAGTPVMQRATHTQLLAYIESAIGTAAFRTLLDDASVAAILATLGGAPLASPALTGTPTAPTAAGGTSTTQLATTAFVQGAVTGGSVADGDKGDVTVSGSGTVWTVDALPESRITGLVADLAAKDTALANHEADTTNIHGIADTSALLTSAAAAAAYQPLDSDLTAIAALTTTAFGRALLALADAAALRTAGGLGTLATANDIAASLISDASANGRSLITAADYAAMRTLLALVVGTNVQAWDADLDTLAGMGSTRAGLLAALPAFVQSLLDDADAATARATLASAPLAATYITQTADGELSAEQALSGLATGYVKNTTGTGVLSVQATPIPAADLGSGGAGAGAKVLADNQTWITPSGGSAVITDFTASGSYTLPVAGSTIRILAQGSGQGGGSGRRGAASSARYGGGGGGGGGLTDVTYSLAEIAAIASSLTITIGAGGAGGAARTADDTDGANGSFGGNTTVAAGAVNIALATGTGGGTGSGGTASAGGGGSGSSAVVTFPGSAGGASSISATAAKGVDIGHAAAGGGGGGGLDTGNTARAGGVGGIGARAWTFSTAPAGGAATGADGTTATATSSLKAPGNGGGGGGAGTGVGGTGGAGVYGGGGGGGAASVNGNNSGAGGAGGAGFVRIMVW